MSGPFRGNFSLTHTVDWLAATKKWPNSITWANTSLKLGDKFLRGAWIFCKSIQCFRHQNITLLHWSKKNYIATFCVDWPESGKSRWMQQGWWRSERQSAVFYGTRDLNSPISFFCCIQVWLSHCYCCPRCELLQFLFHPWSQIAQ